MKLRAATANEQVALDDLTFAAWGETLRLPQYRERERRLRAHAWSQAALNAWVLTDDNDQILSSCETYVMASRRGATVGTSYAIASVFTDEKHRGHRYAESLVREVSAQLLDGKHAQAIVLYSEVGTAMYERAGFAVENSARIDWSIPARAHTHDARLAISNDLPSLTRALELAPDELILQTSAAQLDWHLERERIYAELRNRRAPERHALRLGDEFVVVGADLKHGELVVLQHRLTNANVAPLLAAVADLAWQLGLLRAHLWAPADVTPPSFVELVENRDAIAMLRSNTPTRWTHVERSQWV